MDPPVLRLSDAILGTHAEAVTIVRFKVIDPFTREVVTFDVDMHVQVARRTRSTRSTHCLRRKLGLGSELGWGQQ